MPKFTFTSPDGQKYTVNGPDGATEAQAFDILQKQLAAAPAPAEAPKTTIGQDIKQNLGNIGAGLIRGAGSIGATLAWPVDAAMDAYYDDRGPDIKGLVTGQKKLSRNEQRRKDMDWALGDMGAETESIGYKGGKIAGEIAGTAGAGGALANVARVAAPTLAATATGGKVLSAIASSGFRTGAPAATTAAGRLIDLGIRSTGGAIAGGAGMAMIDPKEAASGAVIGALAPPVVAGIGKVGKAIGSRIAGPAVAADVQAAVQSARAAGYVIPPTQARPTLVNRALEGFAGKLTTAQNASARNQPITNALAQKAIGAADLTEAGIAQVRANANAAYDALGQVGAFQADARFAQALDQAGATSAAMRANFPELVNSKVDDLISGLKSRPTFDAQPTIEAIKQFRADAATNKAALDPAAKAMGRAQNKIAGALEDLIERNLQANGNAGLLDSYRTARQTLAKTYDVEKALNRATGNVDGNKLAQMMQKGKPMTGDLRAIAEFAARFPKANQTVERMGSLPGISPLDFGALGTASAVTNNPLLMAGVVARPMARAAVLSGPVQNNLARAPTPSVVNQLLGNETMNQLAYRAAPAVGSSRR